MRTTEIRTAEGWKLHCIENNLLSFDNPLKYAGYLIYLNDIGWGGKYCFTHESYDGPGDHRLGNGETIEDCIAEINEQILNGL